MHKRDNYFKDAVILNANMKQFNARACFVWRKHSEYWFYSKSYDHQRAFTCNFVLLDTGDTYLWGWNEHGQLGMPARSKHTRLAVAMETLPTPLELPEEPCIIQVACGSRHTVLLDETGRSVFAFGWNKFHQVCASEQEVVDQPQTMELPEDVCVSDVGAGMWCSWLSLNQR